LPICAAATRAAAALNDDNEKKLPPLPDDDPWQPFRALGLIDLDSLDPNDPAIMQSLLQQGLDAAAARQLLEQWEHYVKELARLAEEQRLREEEEERRRQELEKAARQAVEEVERQRLVEEARRIRAEQA
jgi:Mrp family chromosome partitioning ATPase